MLNRSDPSPSALDLSAIDLNFAMQGGTLGGGDAAGLHVTRDAAGWQEVDPSAGDQIAFHVAANTNVGRSDVGLHLGRLSDHNRSHKINSPVKPTHELDIPFAGQISANLDLLADDKSARRHLHHRSRPCRRLRAGRFQRPPNLVQHPSFLLHNVSLHPYTVYGLTLSQRPNLGSLMIRRWPQPERTNRSRLSASR